MPKGKPLAGKREPGGGRKPLPPEQRRTQRNYYLTDTENQQVQAFITELRARTRRQKETQDK